MSIFIDPDDFAMSRLKAGFTRTAAAELLGVSERTVRNWESACTAVPYTAYKLLCIMGGHELPGEQWRGFVVRGDAIWSPEGKAFTCYELAHWQLTCEIARLHLQRAGIAKPLPARPAVVLAITSQSPVAQVLPSPANDVDVYAAQQA